jgi:hypothetical protein
MESNSWVRFAIFAAILFSFLRRLLKAKTQSRAPSPPAQSKIPSAPQPDFSQGMQNNFPQTITPSMAPPRSGRKNDFRDVPPPPENPNLG